jgi:dihydrofolate synthase/folylpolyglutamate synthase
MGGAGDATNVEKKNLAVITHIAMDHTDFLGDTIQKIAHEKSGIIKSGCKCILYPNPECDCVFDNIDNVIKVTDLGDYRQNNLAVAKAVLGVLEYDCDVKLAQLPARQERIDKILIDGGHNLDAGNALAPVIDNEIAVIGMMRDKDIEGYLSVVAPKCKRIITTTPSNSRAISAKELKSLALKYCNDVEAIENPAQAVRQKGVTLVCGSFYLARDIRNFI